MTLKELLKATPWQDIAITLVTAYPNQRKLLEGYQIVFETLKLMAPKDSDLTLHVVYDDSDSEDGGHDVYGTDKPQEQIQRTMRPLDTQWQVEEEGTPTEMVTQLPSDIMSHKLLSLWRQYLIRITDDILTMRSRIRMPPHRIIPRQPDEVVLAILVPQLNNVRNLLPLQEVHKSPRQRMKFLCVKLDVAKHPIPFRLTLSAPANIFRNPDGIPISHPRQRLPIKVITLSNSFSHTIILS